MYAIEREEFEAEIYWHNRRLEDAGLTTLTFYTQQNTDSIGVDWDVDRSTHWFNTFEEAIAFCKSLYPEANWENAGW